VCRAGSDIFGLTDTFLSWIEPSGGWSRNWAPGTALFIAGVFGAFITMYLTDPEYLPQLGGAGRLPRMRQDLDSARTVWLEEAERLRRIGPGTTSQDYERRLDLVCQGRDRFVKLHREYAMERRLALSRGVPLFVVLAGGLAIVLGHNLVEAIAIGAAWPAFLRGLGLERDNVMVKGEAAEIAQREIEQLEQELNSLEQELEAGRKAEQEARRAESQARLDTEWALLAVKCLGGDRGAQPGSPDGQPPPPDDTKGQP
jgi:hypothetical protein